MIRRLASVLAVGALSGAILQPMSAGASGYPAPPAGLHVTAVSHGSFTVGIDRSANARSYRLLVSPLQSDLWWKNVFGGVASSGRRTFSSTRTTLTASSLTYRKVPYYYRVEAIDGAQHSLSTAIKQVSLRPYPPTSVRAVASSSGTYLTWSGSGATRFQVQQADNQAMTVHPRTNTIDGTMHQYSPFGVADGHTYYFRVRALNSSTPSGWASASATVRTRGQSVTVMSYNILMLESDGTAEKGGIIAPWSQRRLAAASLIKGVNPDVIGVQEGHEWVGSTPGTRQVDSLRNALMAIGENYTVASTEITYPNPGWHRAGNYILYKPSVYRAAGRAGHWDIGDGHSAAYQLLQNRTTGARFLFVTVHLDSGSGLTYDRVRQAETASMLRQAGAEAATDGVPVVYTGDFNSNTEKRAHPVDGAGDEMRAANLSDAKLVAQSFHQAAYNSMNQYLRRPLAYSIDIDYVWTPRGVAAPLYGSALHLRDGKFVGTIPSDHDPVYARVVIPF